MVVIVIIGILVAIALPKLFGLSVKGNFLNGNYSDTNRSTCSEYFDKHSDNDNFLKKVKNGYTCKDYLKSLYQEEPDNIEPSTEEQKDNEPKFNEYEEYTVDVMNNVYVVSKVSFENENDPKSCTVYSNLPFNFSTDTCSNYHIGDTLKIALLVKNAKL